jgi:hypothetical protein
MPAIVVEVVEGDVADFTADILALKYAQALYGADGIVYERLVSVFGKKLSRLPEENGYRLYDTMGAVRARQVLYVGVVDLYAFDYRQIRRFGRRVLETLAETSPGTEHLALTLHGPGYGLDELEAFEAELGGLTGAVVAGDYPPALRTITFVERNQGRSLRLQEALSTLIPSGKIGQEGDRSRDWMRANRADLLSSAGDTPDYKPYIFVAMPFLESMDDVFYYGIQGAVKAAGYLCERADLGSFAGDIMDWVKQKISHASLVVADLTGANPNVYLEIGYAWGCGRPTVLVVRDVEQLKFDVKGQRCLIYKSIKHLEESLSKELKALLPQAS